MCPCFFIFFQLNLTRKIRWMSLNNVSKKMFEFYSNMFCLLKDCIFKVLETDVVVNRLPLMFNLDGEPCFPFYWQSKPTRFKSFDNDILTPLEKVERAILEQLPTLLDARSISSLPSTDDPLSTLDGKMFYLLFFCVIWFLP